jgi:predicted MFS family arabinose efflux permease
MGRDRGAALILEQAVLPSTTDDRGRTAVFARYNVLQDIGHALGGLFAAVPDLVVKHAGVSDVVDASRATLAIHPALLIVIVILYARMSRHVEGTSAPVVVTDDTRRVLVRISSLFALDSLGGGFLATALLSYFFFERFGVGGDVVGLLFFTARILNAVSHLGAAWLATRIGLVNTMVFTHLPSSVLLLLIPFAPSWPIAAALFLVRESLVEMDVPTRQSFVMAVVRPEERTLASGVTHVVRMGAWAVAPFIASVLIRDPKNMAVPIMIGAAIKIIYDVTLWIAFRRVKPPEER